MRKNRTFVRAIVVFGASALVMVSLFGNMALAKGPFLAQPPITISLFFPQGTPELISQARASSVGRIISDIPRLYNSSWKPAIQDLAVTSDKTLGVVWLDDIRFGQNQPQANGTSTLDVSFRAIVNGVELEVAHHSYPPDPRLAQDLKTSNATLSVAISVFGPDFTPNFIGELFSQTDPYFQNFNSVAGEISQSVMIQITGKYFGWLSISLLDETTMRVTSPIFPTIYFGPPVRAELVTRTVISSITKSDHDGSVSPWSYGIAGLGIATLGGALMAIIVSRRRER